MVGVETVDVDGVDDEIIVGKIAWVVSFEIIARVMEAFVVEVCVWLCVVFDSILVKVVTACGDVTVVERVCLSDELELLLEVNSCSDFIVVKERGVFVLESFDEWA